MTNLRTHAVSCFVGIKMNRLKIVMTEPIRYEPFNSGVCAMDVDPVFGVFPKLKRHVRAVNDWRRLGFHTYEHRVDPWSRPV
jgi:hypothetical protein